MVEKFKKPKNREYSFCKKHGLEIQIRKLGKKFQPSHNDTNFLFTKTHVAMGRVT